MKMSMSFKNVRNSARLEAVIQEKTQKIAKFFNGKTEVFWTLTKGSRGVSIDIKVHGPSFSYHANSLTDNPYKGVDEAIGKIERQVKRKKDMTKNRIHRGKGAKGADILAFTPKKQTWERELEEYNESIENAA